MSVRCAKCGEELLGAVNRCWKCGQVFARHPEIDGLPPVRMERPPEASEPLDALVLEEPPAAEASSSGTAPPATAEPAAIPPVVPRVAPVIQYVPKPVVAPRPTAEIVAARRHSLMAMGGTVAAVVLGIFAVCLSPFRFEGAIVGLLGLAMGLWGLYSPRRGWAFAAVLLCCLGIALGAYRGANDLYVLIMKNQPVELDQPLPEEESEPQ